MNSGMLNIEASIIEDSVTSFSTALEDGKVGTSFPRRRESSKTKNAFCLNPLDSRLRGNDGMRVVNYEIINIDPASKYYELRHSGLDPESSDNQYRRALRATGYRPLPV